MKLTPKTQKKIHKLLNMALEVHKNNPEKASSLYQKVLDLNPNNADALNLLGMVYFKNHHLDKALALHLAAVKNDPNVADFHNNLGTVYVQMGQLDDALEQFNLALKIDPSYIPAVSNIGNIYQRQEQFDKAIAQYNKALVINPNLSEPTRNIANILWQLNRLEEAEQVYTSVMKDQDKDSQYFQHIGNIYHSQNKFLEAESAFKQGLAIDPLNPELNQSYATHLLSFENFEEGWKCYSYGSKVTMEARVFFPLAKPIWDGSTLKDKTILIYGEQGIGDEIMFAQFIPEISAQAKKCIVACHARLKPLFSRSFSNAVFVTGYNQEILSDIIEQENIDFATPIGELAKYLRPTASSFPKNKYYLKANTHNINKWKKRYQSLGEGLKIGISWKGGVSSLTNLPRSIELEQWLNLLKLPNCHFINLQYGNQSESIQLLKDKHNITLHHWEDSLPLENMDDFAAQTAALDLVISIDNSTVHLAGAVGTPTWLLTPFAADWRWGINRQDSLWYSSITLFHQRKVNNWTPVFTEIIDRLTTIQSSKVLLPYLSFNNLPTVLFVNNCSDNSHWSETCINDAIFQSLNKLILNIDSIFSQEIIKINSIEEPIQQFNNSVLPDSFLKSNPGLIKKIKNATYILINGDNLLGQTDIKALNLLSIIYAAKILLRKPTFLINLSINNQLQKQSPLPDNFYSSLLSLLDGVSTQDTLSSNFLSQQNITHTSSFNLLPLYIENNYTISTEEKTNTIVITGIEPLSNDALIELATYIGLVGDNGFHIKLFIEEKIESPSSLCQHLQTLLSDYTKNWDFVCIHDKNTWLKSLASARLLLSSSPDDIIAANFIGTPSLLLGNTIKNEILTKTLHIHPPIELTIARLCDNLIQNTVEILENTGLFRASPSHFKLLKEQANHMIDSLVNKINQKTTLQQLQSYDLAKLTSIATQALEDKQFSSAIEIITFSLNQHKNDATLLYLQGLAYYHDNKTEESLIFFFKSLEIEPNQEIAYLEIALILGEQCFSINIWLKKLFLTLNKNILLCTKKAKFLPDLLKSLHFNAPGIDSHKTLIYTELVVPLLKSSAQKTLPELALYLENTIYNHYLYQKDSQEFFTQNVCLWVKDLENMGKTIAKKLPALPIPKIKKQDKILVTFFFHNESMLAHIIHITSLVSNYAQSDNNEFRFKAYFLGGHDDKMRSYFKNLNIEIFNLEENNPQKGIFFQLVHLRELINSDNTKIFIWGCLGAFMPFSFGMRTAPHQAWLPVKYKGINISSIDHYLQFHLSGAPQTINGTQWLSFNGLFDFHSSPQEYEEGNRIRSHYSKHSILLGTYARESIIRDEPFLKAVVTILQNNPHCGYLWTGKNQDNYIQNYFEENKVSDRTYFIGWVNINIYATVIDIFLDTFSFMCGHTLLRTMSANKASISLQNKKHILTTPQNHQKIINMSNDLYGNNENKAFAKQLIKDYSIPFMAYSYEEYIEKANKLINDSEARSKCAEANSKIMNFYFHNPKNVIEPTINNLKYILDH